MKTNKKLFLALFALAAMTISACGRGGESSEDPSQDPSQNPSQEPSSQEVSSQDQSSEGGKSSEEYSSEGGQSSYSEYSNSEQGSSEDSQGGDSSEEQGDSSVEPGEETRGYAESKGYGYVELQIENLFYEFTQNDEPDSGRAASYSLKDVALTKGERVTPYVYGQPVTFWAEVDSKNNLAPNYDERPGESQYQLATISVSEEHANVYLHENDDNDHTYALWITPAQDYEAGPVDPIGDATYYLVGSFNGWSKDTAEQLVKDTTVEYAKYTLESVHFAKDDQLKVTDGKTGWYGCASTWPDCGFDVVTEEGEAKNNVVILTSGTYKVDFYPDDTTGNYVVPTLVQADVEPDVPVSTSFSLTISGDSIGESKVYVAGSWDEWEAKTELTLEDGVWTTTIELSQGKEYSFKFLLDNDWDALNPGEASNRKVTGGTAYVGEATYTAPQASEYIVTVGTAENAIVLYPTAKAGEFKASVTAAKDDVLSFKKGEETITVVGEGYKGNNVDASCKVLTAGTFDIYFKVVAGEPTTYALWANGYQAEQGGEEQATLSLTVGGEAVALNKNETPDAGKAESYTSAEVNLTKGQSIVIKLGDVTVELWRENEGTDLSNVNERPSAEKVAAVTVHNDAEKATIYVHKNNDGSYGIWVTGYVADQGGEQGGEEQQDPANLVYLIREGQEDQKIELVANKEGEVKIEKLDLQVSDIFSFKVGENWVKFAQLHSTDEAVLAKFASYTNPEDEHDASNGNVTVVTAGKYNFYVKLDGSEVWVTENAEQGGEQGGEEGGEEQATLSTVNCWSKIQVPAECVDRVYAWVWGNGDEGSWKYCTHVVETWESDSNRHYTVQLENPVGMGIKLVCFNSASGVDAEHAPTGWNNIQSQSGDATITSTLSVF